MTMHIVYLQDHDGHKAGKAYLVERTLARRLCRDGKAIPWADSEAAKAIEDERIKRREDAVKAKAKEAAEAKAKADEEKKAAMLKKKAEDESEKAVAQIGRLAFTQVFYQ